MLGRRSRLAGLFLAVVACGCRRDSPEGRGPNLLAGSEGALRSDSFDLPFLAAHAALEHSGWHAAGTAAAPAIRSAWAQPWLSLPLASPAAKELFIRARSQRSLRAPLDVTLSLDGRLIGTLHLTRSDQDFHLTLSGGGASAAESTLFFSPAAQAAGDEEASAFWITMLEVRPRGKSGPLELPERTPEAVRLPPGSALALALRHDPAAELVVEARGDGRGARIKASYETDALAGPAVDQSLDASWQPVRLATKDLAGSFARLAIASAGTRGIAVRAVRARPAPAQGPAAGESLAKRPSVVMVLTDTLRADHLGAYGYGAPSSPRFDAFAKQSVLFADASANAPWTLPAVASIFTGLTPGSHGFRTYRNRLEVPRTLARTLAEAGYRSAGFCANPLVTPARGFDTGFSTWKNLEGERGRAAAVVENALAWLDAGAGPFFLYLHTMEPHTPYAPSPEHWAPFRPRTYHGSTDIPRLLAAAAPSPEALGFARSAYDGEVHQNDAAFGALLDGLAKRRLLDETLVVFTADHGEEFLDHGGLGHGKTVYQEVVHVPLAVRLPAAARGGTRDAAPIQQIDLMPTLLRLVGARAVAGLDGRDLSARWLGRPAGDESRVVRVSELDLSPKRAARAGRFKLIVNQDHMHYWRAGARLELYDLEQDPAERRNVAADHPLIVAFLEDRLRVAAAGPQRPQHASELPLTGDQREELRALGYVQ